MTALQKSRTVRSIPGFLFNYPVAADAVIYQGAIVALNSSGYARPAGTATGLIAVGIARESVDATGLSSGDVSVEVEEMIAECQNSAGGDEITIAEIGDACYLVDDCTVAKTSGGGTRSIAGYVRKIESGKVFVEFANTQAFDGDLVAANNLSDVASAATARANLGANKVPLTIRVSTLVGTGVTRVVSPVAGQVTKIWTVLEGALATGDATLTSKIGATSITDGVVTITQVGSAAGDVDSATPSAAKTVAVGDVLSVTCGGTNTNAVGATITFLIET